MIDRIREIMIGFGFLETFTLALTSTVSQFDMTGFWPDEDEFVSITKAKATEVNMVRYWLLPELLRALSVNRERRYPIKLFEVSDVVRRDETGEADTVFINRKRLSFIISDDSVTFTDAKRILMKLLSLIDVTETDESISTVRAEHPSFIPGRCAKIIKKKTENEKTTAKKHSEAREIGFLGEIHPSVLERFDIQMPVAACELDLTELVLT